MVRLVVACALLAGCTASARGPAWPKPSEKATDGGESLAPRKESPLGEGESLDDDDDDFAIIDLADTKPTPTADKSDDQPSTTSGAPPRPATIAPDDILNVDDIVIDIDD